MTRLRTTVQSFDLFDTLVARACITPENLFLEVEVAQCMPGFAQQRIHAEQRVAALGQPFGLDTIYGALVESGYCDSVTAQRLYKAEIEAEFDNAIPVACNLAAVRDQDLIVSDMYLPASLLRGLLQHVGLRRHVHLFVTNGGKNAGSIWPHLTENWLLLRHMGDNAHADVTQPQRFGIPTHHYVGASPNATEQFLHSVGLVYTARLIRQLRLSNPFAQLSVEAALWDHFVQFNVPLLLLTSHAVRLQRDKLGLDKLLFLARDCYFLSEVFLTLHPDESMEVATVSREALQREPEAFVKYLQSINVDRSLVCDLVSTGYSWLQFTQTTRLPIAFFALIYTDTYQYNLFDPAELEVDGVLRFRYALRSSELNSWSLAIEMFNTAPHGSTSSIQLVNDTFAPCFEKSHELPLSFLRTLLLAQASSISCLRNARSQVADELSVVEDPNSLVSAMVSALSGTDWINHLAVSTICKIFP